MNQGYIYALLAYGLWGIAPVYFKALVHIGPVEIVANRVFWSVILILVMITVLQKWQRVRTVIRQPRHLFTLALTTLLIATNWLIFVYAIANNRMLEASLGYYINPLVSLFLGYVILQERHSKVKWIAVVLAFVGVNIQVISLGYLPWISLVLAVSFALYGLLHKQTPTDSLTSLFLETSFLMPLAALYIFGFIDRNIESFDRPSSDLILLILAGPITTAPLLFFSGAAKRLPLSLLGFFQYIAPSIMFLLAVFVYKEPFSMERLVTFIFIWAALFLFTWDSIKNRKILQHKELT
ncbi:hypothetical protein TDB9533_03313 [Thalassocella blandensis]|nr:hypothetical protein TDB9533_03313 [Thalassocella blandensis]